MVDLPSGYIFVEEITENCQYETWQQRVAIALKPLGLKVKYLVSDRAKAIVKLALKDLGTHSIADLFHVLYDLNRSIAWELNYLGRQLQKQLKISQDSRAEPELIAQIETNQRQLQQSRLTYEHCCHGLSTCLHPFDINQNTPQTTLIVSMKLIELLHTLQTVQQTHHLKDPRNGIRKLKNQIESLSAVVDLWWSWVDQCLAAYGCEMNLVNACQGLFTASSLLATTGSTHQKSQSSTGLSSSFGENTRVAQDSSRYNKFESRSARAQHWGIWMVSKFQRSSSAREGRNGYLSQVHHNRRGLSPKRLKVSTVIHNFALKRTDGTTAAERLFGRQFPDLFEYLVEHIGELPQPRKSRKSSQSKSFTLPTVPS